MTEEGIRLSKMADKLSGIWYGYACGDRTEAKAIKQCGIVLKQAGYVQLDEKQDLPFCDKFRFIDMSTSEWKCDFALMTKLCPLLKAGFKKVK